MATDQRQAPVGGPASPRGPKPLQEERLASVREACGVAELRMHDDELRLPCPDLRPDRLRHLLSMPAGDRDTADAAGTARVGWAVEADHRQTPLPKRPGAGRAE